jgi:hypothetical protein
MSHRLGGLKRRASTKGSPASGVNDNFGQWKSDFRHTVQLCERSPAAKCRNCSVPAKKTVSYSNPIIPGLRDETRPPARVLANSRIHHHGRAANICVLFTANDAHIRDYQGLCPFRLRHVSYVTEIRIFGPSDA